MLTARKPDLIFGVGDRIRLTTGLTGEVLAVDNQFGGFTVVVQWPTGIGIYDSDNLHALVKTCRYDDRPIVEGDYCDTDCRRRWSAEERAMGENYYAGDDE